MGESFEFWSNIQVKHGKKDELERLSSAHGMIFSMTDGAAKLAFETEPRVREETSLYNFCLAIKSLVKGSVGLRYDSPISGDGFTDKIDIKVTFPGDGTAHVRETFHVKGSSSDVVRYDGELTLEHIEKLDAEYQQRGKKERTALQTRVKADREYSEKLNKVHSEIVRDARK